MLGMEGRNDDHYAFNEMENSDAGMELANAGDLRQAHPREPAPQAHVTENLVIQNAVETGPAEEPQIEISLEP